MNKYDIGDKFVIEIDEVFENNADDIIHETELYRIKGFNSLVFDDNGLDKLQKHDEVKERLELIDELKQVEYNKGLEDAWELTQKLWLPESSGGLHHTKVERIYEHNMYDIPQHFTVQEAFAKLEAYEKAQEINVGDVVRIDATHSCGIVIAIDEIQRKARLMYKDTSFRTNEWYLADLKKTGKHIDISSILEQIKE